MKTKDVIQLVVALAIFVAAGYLLFIQFSPKSAKTADGISGPSYEKITPIPEQYDQEALTILNDPDKSRDFYTRPDLRTGLNNTQPFGPLH
jgi:flagellar basal body-associated protein FliL